MSDELADSILQRCDRIIAGDYWYEHGDDNGQRFDQMSFERDAKVIAERLKADLARREQAERERGLPSNDEQFLLSIGFEGSKGYYEIKGPFATVILMAGRTPDNDWWMANDRRVPSELCDTRGALLNLLRGLQIPVKGGAK